MVPVATTQRELSAEAQKNLKLLTGQNFPLEARQIGAVGLLQQGSSAIAALRQILLNQPLPIVVQAIAMAIPETKSPPVELVDPLVQQLSAEDGDVRNAVVSALISYRDHDLPTKLHVVAANMQNTQPTRLAAVTVLGQLADRDSIETLIALIETPDDQVRQSALNALGQLTGVNFGFDSVQWQRWWQANRNRKPQEWAAGVIASLTEDKRAATEEVRSLRAQLAKAQRDIYRLSPESDRPKEIIACLSSPVPDVRLVGVNLINMLIPTMDRKSLSSDVVVYLRKLITDPDNGVRLQTVRILGDLRSPDDARILLEALNQESDPVISQAITRALGLLRNTAAIPVLLEKLNKGDGPIAAAAAAGLSDLCQKGDPIASPEQLDQVVMAMKIRMESVSDMGLRRAILDAMARIADERFRDQFLAALQSSDPAIRQSAAKAFADLNGPGDAEKILAPMLADPEAVVREAVCAAIGKIGKPSQLVLLLQRCDEQTEPNLAVRRAAEDAGISIMLRMDRPMLRSQLDQLVAGPGQVNCLTTVLEKALLQAGQDRDGALKVILYRSLAAAKVAINDKKAAADLWVKVILLQPADGPTISSLARVLFELDNPDSLVNTLQQIATGQSSALSAVLIAIAKEMKNGHATSRVVAMAEAIGRIDSSTWSTANQEALRSCIEAGAATTRSSATAPAAPTASAEAASSAPATMAHRKPQ